MPKKVMGPQFPQKKKNPNLGEGKSIPELTRASAKASAAKAKASKDMSFQKPRVSKPSPDLDPSKSKSTAKPASRSATFQKGTKDRRRSA